MAYRCRDCGRIFSEPKSVTDVYEDYYGVAEHFGNSHAFSYASCPRCGSESYENICDFRVEILEIEEEKETRKRKVYYKVYDVYDQVCDTDYEIITDPKATEEDIKEFIFEIVEDAYDFDYD